MAEHGHPGRRVRGIDSGFEGYTVCGAESEALSHVNSIISQTPEATRMTTASTADARRSQRVCMEK